MWDKAKYFSRLALPLALPVRRPLYVQSWDKVKSHRWGLGWRAYDLLISEHKADFFCIHTTVPGKQDFSNTLAFVCFPCK